MYSHVQLSWIVAAAQRGGKGVLCHSYSQQGCYDAATAGIRSLEHGVFVDERTVGRLEPGFSGDVLVVAGDPHDDVSVLKKPVHVVRAGLPV